MTVIGPTVVSNSGVTARTPSDSLADPLGEAHPDAASTTTSAAIARRTEVITMPTLPIRPGPLRRASFILECLDGTKRYRSGQTA
ncbi:hypothetical protein CQ045_00890 [Microbacterium sp. MYb66]|nr:hypothetical protein CQ045_00890 [Microbacterium sp. MYb66]